MNRSLLPITCLMLLALLAGCVLPGGAPPAVPPTITSVAVPDGSSLPDGGTPTTAAPAEGQTPTDTPAPAEGAGSNSGQAPAVVRVQVTAPATDNGQPFTITMLVNNRTRVPIAGARAVLPLHNGLELVEARDGGTLEGTDLVWNLPDLPANNGRAEVHAVVRFRPAIPNVLIENFRIDAPGLDPAIVEISAPRYVFPGEVAPIQAVQGSGESSPYEGDMLAVEGVVTGVFPGLGGFFLFEGGGLLPGASQGLYVDAPQLTDTIRAGMQIRARGTVREEEGQTTLAIAGADDVQVIHESAPLPGAFALDPPQDSDESLRYLEAMEGMPVAISGVAVSPINRYGEFVLVRETHQVGRIFQGAENGYAVMVDDGSSREHADASTLPALIRTGDYVSSVSGPLAFTFGRFKVEPTVPYSVSTTPISLPSIAPAGPGEISVMTWNVENLFDTAPPNPSDPPLPSAEEYALDLRKVAATITAAGAPDVVALQEVENLTVLQDIAAVDVLVPFAYQPVLEEGTDQRGIDVGYLVRSDRVDVVEVRQFAENQGVYTRPPLLLRVRPKAGGGEVSLINNHFTSMTSGVEESEPRRVLQAQGNLSIVEELRESDPNAAVAVLGDLNAFYQSAPIDVLRNGGLQHVLEKLTPEHRYTYIYQGESQVLDHMLVSDPLWQRITRVEILHVNSDFPPPQPEDVSPIGKSDHDPVIVVFGS